MNIYRGNIAKRICGTTKTLVESLLLKAYAEEPPADDSGEGNSTSSPVINYEDLIAKARKEEKQKQYGTIEKLKTQIATLTKQHNDDLVKIATLEEKVSQAEAKLTTASKGDSDEITTLKNEITALKGDKSALEEKVNTLESNKPASREEVEAQVRAELETEYKVKTHRATRLAELKDDILVPELVMGDTIEAVDESIQAALERSEEIRKSLGISSDKKQQKRTPKSPANPSVGRVQDSEVSLEHLATLDVRSKEYAELRKQLGLK